MSQYRTIHTGPKWIPIDTQYTTSLLAGKGKFIKRHWDQMSSRLANIMPLSENAGGTVSLTTTGGATEEPSVEHTMEYERV